MNQGSLYTHIENHIATVEFFHPASNALPQSLLERLAEAFKELATDEEVHIIVLKSEKERAFCAGAYFDELLNIKTKEEGKTFFMGFANVINAMRKCPQPIIGRMQGKVVGGGVGLVATCDYCIATEDASVKLSELSIGIGPFVIAPAVERKIGLAGLNALLFNPENWKNAYWAKEKGLYMSVFETIEEMDKELSILTSKLASYSREALVASKKMSWQGTEHWDNLLQERAGITGELVLSDFVKKKLGRVRS
ncbi:MAG: enoyl-CoA hydratase/isomerase family protein [Flavobacteriaceae bacterium]|nr:enoyl-CoA hydratase/isomerase family protein [Flavobacteriaceae bacterium]